MDNELYASNYPPAQQTSKKAWQRSGNAAIRISPGASHIRTHTERAQMSHRADLRDDHLRGRGPHRRHHPEPSDALNALSPFMITELRTAYDAAENDDQVWTIIVTANGRAFCTGADVKAIPGDGK